MIKRKDFGFAFRKASAFLLAFYLSVELYSTRGLVLKDEAYLLQRLALAANSSRRA